MKWVGVGIVVTALTAIGVVLWGAWNEPWPDSQNGPWTGRAQ